MFLFNQKVRKVTVSVTISKQQEVQENFKQKTLLDTEASPAENGKKNPKFAFLILSVVD